MTEQTKRQGKSANGLPDVSTTGTGPGVRAPGWSRPQQVNAYQDWVPFKSMPVTILQRTSQWGRLRGRSSST